MRLLADSLERLKQHPRQWADYLREIEQVTGMSVRSGGKAV
jgi:hypothetical protein